jgi:hypothetical protein
MLSSQEQYHVMFPGLEEFCGVWPIKCCQGSKRTNQIVNFKMNLTFD